MDAARGWRGAEDTQDREPKSEAVRRPVLGQAGWRGGVCSKDIRKGKSTRGGLSINSCVKMLIPNRPKLSDLKIIDLRSAESWLILPRLDQADWTCAYNCGWVISAGLARGSLVLLSSPSWHQRARSPHGNEVKAQKNKPNQARISQAVSYVISTSIPLGKSQR